MRKIFSFLLVATLSLSLFACNPTEEAPAPTSPSEEVVSTPADKVLFEVGESIDPFWQGALDGVNRAAAEFGFTVDVSEARGDPSRQKEDIRFAADSGDYKLIITGAYAMVESITEAATTYPDQLFIFFDEDVSGYPNIASVTYDQYEGSFLAGALAGLITTSTDQELANPEKVVGFIGGMQDPTVDEFRDGFEAGAKYIDPEIEFLSGYLGSWNDPAKGKEMASAQIEQGADIIFSVAGGGDNGVFEEVIDKNLYAVACDVNMNPSYPGHVVTSMIKRAGDSLYQLISLYYQGKLEFGKNLDFGLKNQGVGLAKDEFYEDLVSDAIKERITQIEQDIDDGKIIVTK